MSNYADQALAAADRDRRDAGTGRRAVGGRPGVGQHQRLAVGLTHTGVGDVPRRPRPRLHILAAWLFDHRADLLAALVYGCLAFLSFSALSDYANAHALFPLPYGGWAFAVAIDGTVLYAFISFKRARWLASLLLLSGAATSFVLQQWHSSNDHHPAVVAGVVPAAMVLVTFAWHRIKAAEAKAFRPTWPIDYPEPTPEPVPGPEPVPVPEARPRGTQDVTHTRGRPVTRGRPFTPDDHPKVEAWVNQGRTNKAEMARELGLHKRGQLDLGRYVNHLRDEPVRVGRNGNGP